MNYILLFSSLFGGSGSSDGTQSSPLPMILMMVGLFAVMYFVMIRPQKKK